MSQPRSRSRKVVATDDGRPRPSFTVAKASGDTAAYTSRPNQETRRSRSKNKIPKSVRYDLENALVSLCDVWFEEIKPHLVRNNIKLHVHGSNASGDQERPLPSAPPSPTALRTLLVHPAPGCSHLDPGAASYHRLHRDASCIGCFSTPPTASRVLCPRPRAPSRRHIQAPVPSLRQTPCDSTQNCEEKQLKRPRNRRNQRRSQAQPQPQSSWRVPRLCRTYGALRPAATGSRAGRAGPRPPQPRDDYVREHFNSLFRKF